MKDSAWKMGKRHRSGCLVYITILVALSTYVEQVVSMPTDTSANEWPTFPRRNIAALARDGYLRGSETGFKRSISTLAKNGQLPTYRAPYDITDKEEQDSESHEKRNLASIARLRSYSTMKRNIQALARDGYRGGRGQYNQQNEKRNIQALARDGMIHKRNEYDEDDYNYPMYPNIFPPMSEIDSPFDANEMYDFQQSINPDMLTPLSQIFKRTARQLENNNFQNFKDDTADYFKRGAAGLPVHGLYRPMYIEPTSRSKRYILSMPDVIDKNDIHISDNDENDEKRSVGSIPMTRISELGNISLVPKLTQIQTTPTYRRRQYLLTRTRQAGSSTDH